MVGNVAVGGTNPIRLQSMTTTLTKDIDGTVSQCLRLVEAGCEIVRITTPTPADARCLETIKDRLRASGVTAPIVADIHFSPQAAMVAAEYADKVRVNPGNYVDSRKFAVREYTDDQYREEVERAAERFTPLVLKCRERGVAMRIGTNHGSLSDRIMNRFGDTPEGMVESALEFVNVCRDLDYHDIILSMKASNPKVMIAAYRLLAARMNEVGMDYPFHLGVTEAGNAEDGRIKSAIGIGSLLADGIGDTIRVSLTEEPEEEIPVARAIADMFNGAATHVSKVDTEPTRTGTAAWDSFHYQRRDSESVNIGARAIGDGGTVLVSASLEAPSASHSHALSRLLRWASPAGRRQPKPDMAFIDFNCDDDVATLTRAAGKLQEFPGAQLSLAGASRQQSLLLKASPHVHSLALYLEVDDRAPITNLVKELGSAGKSLILCGFARDSSELERLASTVVSHAKAAQELGVECLVCLDLPYASTVAAYRRLASRAKELGTHVPILLMVDVAGRTDDLGMLLSASIPLGSLLCDGIGDAVLIKGMGDSVTLSFNILQAAGTRISKTDYVACPSCGRTLFDLQETTERIKSRTSHLVGVRLAIMGCIVNGPGEMADADFGYVGGAPGKVNLYVGKECVEKGVPEAEADDRLIALIKSHGRWQENEAVEDESASLIEPRPVPI
jgi:(E)-4-hydroxy-3-methylbut-2-enyl-diphosphate synthase